VALNQVRRFEFLATVAPVAGALVLVLAFFARMVFRITPLRAPDAQSQALEASPLAGLRVLAVDDDPDSLELMAELFSMRGAEVRTVTSAAAALTVLEAFEPDVLVSDISMPGRDGYDLIRDVRNLGRSAEDLPAVAVTALASPEDRRRALAAGYQVHMPKPVDPNELTALLARLGRERRGSGGDRPL
jgi:CheY-like chemotaxis protein